MRCNLLLVCLALLACNGEETTSPDAGPPPLEADAAQHRAIFQRIEDVLHGVLVEPIACPEGLQDGRGDGRIFRENSEIQVALPDFIQTIDTDLDRAEQVGIGVIGELLLDPVEIGRAQAVQCILRPLQTSSRWLTRHPTCS